MQSGIFVLLASLVGAVGVELISWLLVYRTERYRQAKLQLITAYRKLELSQGSVTTGKSRKKKDALQHGMQEAMRHISTANFRLTIISAVLFFVLFRTVTRSFRGVPVAYLPLDLPRPLTWLTHRGLDGKDLREVSVSFLYVLCQMTVRKMVGKLANFGVSAQVQSAAPLPDTAWGRAMAATRAKVA